MKNHKTLFLLFFFNGCSLLTPQIYFDCEDVCALNQLICFENQDWNFESLSKEQQEVWEIQKVQKISSGDLKVHGGKSSFLCRNYEENEYALLQEHKESAQNTMAEEKNFYNKFYIVAAIFLSFFIII